MANINEDKMKEEKLANTIKQDLITLIESLPLQKSIKEKFVGAIADPATKITPEDRDTLTRFIKAVVDLSLTNGSITPKSMKILEKIFYNHIADHQPEPTKKPSSRRKV